MKIDYVLDRPVVNHYLVRERDRRRLLELALVGFAILLVGSGLLAYTWVHLELLRLGYSIEELGSQLEALEQEERRLELEAAVLTNPQRVRDRALEELAMRPPRPDQLVFEEELQ